MKKYNYLGNGDVHLNKTTYPSGLHKLTLVDAEDGLPFATCTVPFSDLEKDEVAVKDYSENEGMLEFLVKNHIVQAPHRFIASGFVKIPVCKLK